MKRRVVVTGYGVVSPLGNSVTELWKNVQSGVSAVKRIDDMDYEEISTKIGAPIIDFDPSKYITRRDQKRYDLFIQYGYVAAMQALESANVDLDSINKERVGVYIGTGAGGMNTLLENHTTFMKRGARRVSPFLVPMMINNMASGIVAIDTGFKGPSFAPMSACATGNQAIGEAYLNILHGYSDAILAGGTEAMMNALAYAGFSRMRAMSTNNDTPEQASRPFDKNRDGFVMGEGAGVLFLESYEHAKSRGAKILGEIVGYGATTDAYHITSPDPEGAARAMQLAVERAGVNIDEIDYINAHGTSTPDGDVSETKAIKQVFGKHAKKLLISSTKSMIGHLFGAAGGVETIVTLKSLQVGIVPPTIHLDNPDPACDLNYVPNESVKQNINYALSNGFGFGGHNAVLALKKFVE